MMETEIENKEKMQYPNKGRKTGKTKVWALQLQINIECGLDCIVMTLNPTRTQADFKMITGKELTLIKRYKDEDDGVYTATLHHI